MQNKHNKKGAEATFTLSTIKVKANADMAL
jgi:hypothetical protein